MAELYAADVRGQASTADSTTRNSMCSSQSVMSVDNG
jgi:hypothetical protein